MIKNCSPTLFELNWMPDRNRTFESFAIQNTISVVGLFGFVFWAVLLREAYYNGGLCARMRWRRWVALNPYYIHSESTWKVQEDVDWRACYKKDPWKDGEERVGMEARCEINRFIQTAAVLTPCFLHSLSSFLAHPAAVFQHAVKGIVVLYFLTVPVFPHKTSAPTACLFYYIHSKLDPKDLISLNVYLLALCCLICWRVVHLSQSTKHCLSVCFGPLFYHLGKVGWVFMFLESIKDIYSHISNLKAMTKSNLGQFVVSPEMF